ncbi:low-density lipoprotein receptor-like [Lytechinus pictus]|uniref:low-density lipoprotein receptor-like n=1 Tax=Lytechinus pictus TaxID=7653 RepID=UPI0030B9D942
MASFCALFSCAIFTVLVLMTTEINCTSTTTTTPTPSVDMIFIADTGHKEILAATMGRYRFSSLVREDIEVWDVLFSEANQKLYYAKKHDGHIYESNADGSGVRQVSSKSHTEPTSLSIDEINQEIYVAYKGGELISSFNLNGATVRETRVHKQLSKPGAIYVDAENGYLYFTQFAGVWRSSLSGKDLIPLHHDSDLGEIEAIAVDVQGERIVVSDPGNGKVVSMHINGTRAVSPGNPPAIELVDLSSPYKITDVQFFNGDLYVSNEREQRAIMKLANGNGLPKKIYSDTRDVLSYPRKFHIAKVNA